MHLLRKVRSTDEDVDINKGESSENSKRIFSILSTAIFLGTPLIVANFSWLIENTKKFN